MLTESKYYSESERISNQFGGRLVNLPDVRRYLDWYKQAEFVSDWDTTRYMYCIEVINAGILGYLDDTY